jgi:hypothetical protein
VATLVTLAQEERGVDQCCQSVDEELPVERREGSYPKQAFGPDTNSYWSFLDAILSGLSAYEARFEGRHHATQPLPVA